jgi:hypothetical protein
MKEKFMVMRNWLVKTTVKQKITLGICTVAVFSIAGLGIYQLIPNQSDGLNLDGVKKTNVTVNDINEAQIKADKLANTSAETTPVEPVQQTQPEATNVVSNTTTVDTPTTTEDVYIADDGAHYESEPVYSEPAYEEPVYEEPAAASSDGGWDGNLGGDWGEADYTGSDDYGTGISN